MKCYYCKTEPINSTTNKNLKVCCCYRLQNLNGEITQHYSKDSDEIDDLKVQIAIQKAEIERLQGDIKEKTDTIDFLKEQVINWNNDYCELKMKFKSVKSEVYKEIIVKLKEHLCSYDLPNYHSFRAIDEDTIDEVLNEMVGKSSPDLVDKRWEI